jgi:hypothetical protein
MYFYITNVILDVTFGTLWWLLKTTGYVMYQGVLYFYPTDTTKQNGELAQENLEDSVVILEREEFYELLRKQAEIQKNIQN